LPCSTVATFPSVGLVHGLFYRCLERAAPPRTLSAPRPLELKMLQLLRRPKRIPAQRFWASSEHLKAYESTLALINQQPPLEFPRQRGESSHWPLSRHDFQHQSNHAVNRQPQCTIHRSSCYDRFVNKLRP